MQEPSIVTEPKRDGTYIVVRDGTTLPARCAVCNKEASGGPIEISFDDQRRGGLIGAAVAEAVNAAKGSYYTGPVNVRFHLCKAHRAGARYVWFALFVLLIAGGVGAIYCNTLRGDSRELGLALSVGGAIGVLATMFGLLTGLLHTWSFKPAKFNDRLVWLKGSKEAFLQSLSERESR